MTYRKTKSGLVDYGEVIGVDGLKITIDDSMTEMPHRLIGRIAAFISAVYGNGSLK